MPDEKDGNRESENAKSYLFRFHFVKMLKEKLRSLTEEDEEEKETDPEEIKSIVYLLKKYGYKPLPPEEFEKDKFLDRFYLKNSLGPYRYPGKIGRCFALWKKRNEPKIKPFKQLAYVTIAMTIGLFLVIFDHVTYAGNFKEVYQIQRYAEDNFLIIAQSFEGDTVNKIHSQKENATLKQIPEHYYGEIYLPIDLLKDSSKIECYNLQEDSTVLYIKCYTKDNRWFILYIIEEPKIVMNFQLGDDDVLKNNNCIWKNSQISYNKVSKVSSLLFEIDNKFYLLSSDIETEKLVEIVNQMEMYK